MSTEVVQDRKMGFQARVDKSRVSVKLPTLTVPVQPFCGGCSTCRAPTQTISEALGL